MTPIRFSLLSALVLAAACSPEVASKGAAGESADTGAPLVEEGQDKPDFEGGVKVPMDRDGDGYFSPALPGQMADCNDLDASISPEGEEVCDGKDNDCSGGVDDDPVDGVLSFDDDDADGFGEPGSGIVTCELPFDRVEDDSDCDDRDAQSYPGADEICDGIDNDCDGGLPATELDLDRDGRVNCADPDIDGDGLTNGDEEVGATQGVITDPYDMDSDDDGVGDAWDAMPLDPACGDALFDTRFDEVDALWEVIAGEWALTDGMQGAVMSNRPTHPGEAIWLEDREWTDTLVEARIQVAGNSGDAGILLRIQEPGDARNDSQQAYYVGLYPGADKVVFGKMSPGWRALASAKVALEPEQWVSLRVVAKGSHFDVSIDGEPVLTLEDHSYAWGSVGLRTYKLGMDVDRLTVCP